MATWLIANKIQTILLVKIFLYKITTEFGFEMRDDVEVFLITILLMTKLSMVAE